MVGLWYDSSIFCGITSHYHPIVGSGFSFPILCSFALHPGTPNIHTISSQYFDVSQLDNFSYNIYVHVRPSRIPKGEISKEEMDTKSDFGAFNWLDFPEAVLSLLYNFEITSLS